MGMAASQARYLALVARKSNCEYEGQQINQARLVLSNKSAGLFSQMTGFEVPVPPSTSDYTKIEYTFTDGPTTYTIDSWEQLATPEDEYNYVVKYHYNKDTYTGKQVNMSDPQVQFSTGSEVSEAKIIESMKELTEAKEAWDKAEEELAKVKGEAATLTNYKTGIIDRITKAEQTTDGYNITTVDEEGTETTTLYASYANLTPEMQANLEECYNKLKENGVYDDKSTLEDFTSVVYSDGTNILFKEDIDSLSGTSAINYYTTTDISSKADEYSNNITQAKLTSTAARSAYDLQKAAFDSLATPTYVGNCKLELLASLTDDQAAELAQIVKDMKAEEITTNIAKCFDSEGNYTGGIYTFTYNNKTYYTTFQDLLNSYKSGTGINHIDGQVKLPYYAAENISKQIDETKKALLETDGKGRFKTVRFEDDSVVRTLSSQTTTDDNAYQDAMNEYNYKSTLYDKAVQEINAKTSLIQQQDKELELRLKQLDTEQNALSTEIDAVTKVIKDNVEKSFKTFGG